MSPTQSWSGPCTSKSFATKGKIGPSWSAVGGAGEARPVPGVEVVLAHQPAHLLGIDHLAAVAQLGADAAVAVALELVGDRSDLGDERRRRRASPPARRSRSSAAGPSARTPVRRRARRAGDRGYRPASRRRCFSAPPLETRSPAPAGRPAARARRSSPRRRRAGRPGPRPGRAGRPGLLDPDPDQVAREIVAPAEHVRRLAGEILGDDLSLEVDAVSAVSGHGPSSSESPAPVNSNPPDLSNPRGALHLPPPGRRDRRARQGRRARITGRR